MNPDISDQIVRWTARLTVAAYLARLLADVAGPPAAAGKQTRRERIVLVVWTLGCGFYLLHVAAAFQFVHDWSHAAAASHTARQTAAVTGWHWSGGLWINYAVTLWWPLDVSWTWRRGLERVPRRYIIAVHVILGFLVFNATAVFGPPWWRWVIFVIVVFLIGVDCRSRRRMSRLYHRTRRDHTADT